MTLTLELDQDRVKEKDVWNICVMGHFIGKLSSHTQPTDCSTQLLKRSANMKTHLCEFLYIMCYNTNMPSAETRQS